MNCNFLHFFGVMKAIQQMLKKTSSCETTDSLEKQISVLNSRKLYCLHVKPKLRHPTSMKYWSDRLRCNITDVMWEKIFQLPRHTTNNNFVRELQLKINHHTYASDSYVGHFIRNINRNCKFCQQENDILHWFIECSKVIDFWTLFTKWIIRTFQYDVSGDIKHILFGILDDNMVEVNFCILIAKLYVHNIRQCHRDQDNIYFSFTSYLYDLKEYLSIEKEITYMKNQTSFETRFKTLLENL